MIKINDRTYPVSEEDYLIKDLIKNGDLMKEGGGYKWSQKYIKKQISSAKHIMIYIRYPLYRFFVNLFKDLK